jgi:hypothetical protein
MLQHGAGHHTVDGACVPTWGRLPLLIKPPVPWWGLHPGDLSNPNYGPKALPPDITNIWIWGLSFPHMKFGDTFKHSNCIVSHVCMIAFPVGLWATQRRAESAGDLSILCAQSGSAEHSNESSKQDWLIKKEGKYGVWGSTWSNQWVWKLRKTNGCAPGSEALSEEAVADC